MTDFLALVDTSHGPVKPKPVTLVSGGAEVSPYGRLVTIDGFALQGGLPGSNPKLNATFALTTYVSPADQGLTAGASPTAPATTTQPASAVVSK